jgi:hypothetical protein
MRQESEVRGARGTTLARAGAEPKPVLQRSAAAAAVATRCMSFEDGAAMLRPREATRPVQAMRVVQAIQMKKQAGTDAQWTAESGFKAYAATRTLGWNPEWITALQAMVGVDPTGVATRELADAIAAQEETADRPQTGRVDGDNTAWLESLYPVLTTISRGMGEGSEAAAQAKGRGAGCPEDSALKKLNLASSYSEYAASVLRTGTFCGHAVIGHPAFLGRLRAAEAWLSSYNDGLVGEELGAKLGLTEVSSYRRNTSVADQLLHGIGFALDVNPDANDWNFGTSHQAKFTAAMQHAGELLGEAGLIADSHGLGKAAKDKTTEEAFEDISASNEALRRYRAFALDKASLEAHLASEACPSAAKSKGLSSWWRMVQTDHKRLVTRTGNTEESEKPAGFMDYTKQMVTALRDAAGLRWGGTDFGGDLNGDLMHFDGNDTPPGKQIRNAVREARKAAGEPFT